ncbi:venom serine protease-like isoform X2 [Anopheles merus]|uniref:Peptidase S1 domain-containing protein n=1 Tax=Anopheles merus TaxID=30066 RepID=A0A182VAR8_ANOME|nr:venom serine protease-like isoform X2 [Anopheles merus]
MYTPLFVHRHPLHRSIATAPQHRFGQRWGGHSTRYRLAMCGSNVLIAWLFALVALAVSPAVGQFTGCDRQKTLAAGEVFYVESPSFPNYYARGTNCRWQLAAPAGNTIYVNCYDMYLAASTGCTADRVEISLQNDPTLAYATKYCGQRTFTLQATGNRAVFALRTTTTTSGGRFRCQVVAQAPKCSCGLRRTSKIVNGVPTLVNEFPMMAGLVDSSSRSVFCGATIISDYHSITAAHCMRGRSLSASGLLVGDHNLSVGTDTSYSVLMRLASVTNHPQYVVSPSRNDIALVRTADRIAFNAAVGPACLPFRYSTSNFAGSIVEATGWGTMDFGAPTSNVLRKVSLSVISQQSCQSSMPNILASHICTYTPGKDTCQYDSGGPLLFTTGGRVYLVGVVNYGVSCASSKPSVSSRITSYLSWIQSVTPGVTYCTP